MNSHPAQHTGQDQPARAWVTLHKASHILEVSRNSIKALAESGRIRRRQLPNQPHPRYFRPDLEAIAEASIIPCGPFASTRKESA